MHWVPRGRLDRSIWKCVQYRRSVVIRARNNIIPERLSSCSIGLSIPGSNGAVVGPGDNAAPIGRVGNGPHPASVPLEGITDWSASLGIPDSNSAVIGSGDDVAPIGRVSNGLHHVGVPLKR